MKKLLCLITALLMLLICTTASSESITELFAGFEHLYIDTESDACMVKPTAKALTAYLSTIMPIRGWNAHFEKREEIRGSVNTWIRAQKEADGIVDFDQVSRDPEDSQRLFSAYACGDHLHPSWQGAKNTAESVPADCLK